MYVSSSRTYTTDRMATKAKAKGRSVRKTVGRAAERKKSKTYRLSEGKIAAAQEILGVATATAAIETALDMVVFRKELVDGTASMLGVPVATDDD
jgi:hypothetical protein